MKLGVNLTQMLVKSLPFFFSATSIVTDLDMSLNILSKVSQNDGLCSISRSLWTLQTSSRRSLSPDLYAIYICYVLKIVKSIMLIV